MGPLPGESWGRQLWSGWWPLGMDYTARSSSSNWRTLAHTGHYALAWRSRRAEMMATNHKILCWAIPLAFRQDNPCPRLCQLRMLTLASCRHRGLFLPLLILILSVGPSRQPQPTRMAVTAQAVLTAHPRFSGRPQTFCSRPTAWPNHQTAPPGHHRNAAANLQPGGQFQQLISACRRRAGVGHLPGREPSHLTRRTSASRDALPHRPP